jgi:4-amino-4-deoxy-L-arabinose transferase-like glycosyltransferase
MEKTDRHSRAYLVAAIAATALVRLAAFPFAENFYGDPIMRLHTLSAWLAHPFFLRSFQGAHQFGPLHLYLLAAGEWLTGEQMIGPRVLSLAFGSLTAWPLFRLAEERFGASAALLSSLAFAVYGLHVQASTTAVSEAVFLFFLLFALAQLDRAADGGRHLVIAGLSRACACAVRYDGWIYAPLSILWLVGPLRRQAVRPAWVAGYAILVLAVPALLMWGNWLDMRDPLYLIHYIDEDHIRNAQRASTAMGRFTYAAYCLAFWPANLLLEMTPFVFIASLVGAAVSARERGPDLWLLALVPAAYFSLKGALMLAFHPLARFTIPTAVLLMPYVGGGLELLAEELGRRWRPALYAATAISAVAIPAFLAARTMGRSDSWADTMRPISPVSNLPPDLSATASWLKQHAAGRRVVIESNWLYEELPISFYADLPRSQMWNVRYGPAPSDFGVPDLLVVPKDSDLSAHGGIAAADGGIDAYGRHFHKVIALGRVTIFGATAHD